MKLKNLSSVILAAMMAATSVPAASLIAPYNSLSAYAVETAEPEEEAPIASGLCGENLTWEVFAEEDSLVIDGSGTMTEWEKAEDAPWAEYGDRISLVVIRENVESVSENAFGATGGRIFYFDSFDCVIPDSETFLPEDASIHGFDGSTAQAYAEKYGREFTSEGEYEAPTDENVPTDKEDSTVIEGESPQGMCGETLKWEIDTVDDVLIISGYGEMTDWEKPEDTPWFEYSNKIGIVIIRPGVGEISENSFTSRVKLIYLTSYDCVIPDSETVIPADATILGYTGSTAQAYAEKYGREFETLSGENEEYPLMEGVCTENLEWILWDDGSLGFYGYGDIVAENGVYPWDRVADKVKTIVINTAVRSIDENAFKNCTNLESVLMYTPDCKIADSADVFPSDVLLQVGDGSTAEEYAVKYNLTHDVYNFFTASGEIGDNLTWVLFYGGSLRIYGEGDMIDLGGVSPWAKYKDEITRVQINDEVTSVDKAAFKGCDKIAEMIVLNPECKFSESKDAIPENAVIFGAKGSGASMYAQMFGRSFKTLSSELTAPEEEAYIAYGELGENLTWKLLDDGMLEIDGEGEMLECGEGGYPWSDFSDKIKKISLAKEVTSVGAYAFYNCKNLETMHLAPVVGAHAYDGCSNVTVLGFYEDLTINEIGDYAFNGCDSLGGLTIENPDCVIADSKFVFPANITINGYNGSTAQAHAEKYGLDFVEIASEEQDFVAQGKLGDNLSWIISNKGTLHMSGNGDMIEIDGAYPWDEYADQITQVSVGENITSISAGAFDDCANIHEVWVYNKDCVIADVDNVFPANVSIHGHDGSTAQAYAEKYNMEFVSIRTSVEFGNFGENFAWIIYDNGTIVISGSGEMPEYEIGNYPWSEHSDMIKDIQLGKEVENIAPYAFYNCTNLETIHLAPVIGEHAYDGCINADSVGYYSDLTVNEIGDYAFNNCGVSTYEITNPDCVIADSEFVFPAGATIEGHVGSTAQAHAEKYGLKFVDIAETTVEKIADGELGNNLFWNLWSSGILNIYGNGDMIEIDGAYPWDEYADLITNVYVNENVTSISAGAFDDCVNLRSADIKNRKCVIADVDNVFPANVSIYGYNGSPAQAYAEKYNMDFTAIRTEIVSGKLGKGFEWTIFDDNTILIDGVGEMPEYEAGNYPWSEYSDMIKDIQLGKEVSSIAAYAFYNCTNLETIHLAPVIGAHAYDGCINVNGVCYYSDLTVNEIGDYAFNNCGLLSYEITNPNCVIADSEFVFPKDATIEGLVGSTAQAHAEKYGLNFAVIEEVETAEIANGELGENLTWSLYNDGVIYINGVGGMLECEVGCYPWSEYSDMIKHVEVDKEVESIGAYAFYNCTNLETIHLAPVIGAHAYDGCVNAGGVRYYSDLTIKEIGDYAFNNCGFFVCEITNPDCVIADSEYVFPAGATIEGHVGSTAQAHAEKYGLDFVIIGEESVITTAPDSNSETTTTTTTTANDSESELPQTGFSRAYDYLALSAGVMAICGIYAMKKGKKKEDEE